MSSRSDGGWPPFPLPQSKPIPLKKIAPDVLASRSQSINPWIKSNRACCCLTKTPFRGIFRVAGGVREPTPEELCTLASFPRNFIFLGGLYRQWERIGNSVPPRLTQAIAEVLRDEVLGTDRFTYISTFAGCGGSSLGYKWAGGRGLAAVEFDDNAVATYRANFPDTPVIDRDIAKVTAEELMEVARIGVGQLDILDGSPPCQGFSTAGKRVITDPRNSLFREYVRLIEGLQPRVFVMENVSGMVKGKMKLVFREVMLALKATGYDVRCKLLNAMYFNVPQSRERLIWIGVRPDVEKPPTFPKAQGKPVTVREALEGCPQDDAQRELLLDAGRRYKCYRGWEQLKPGETLQKVLGDGQGFNAIKPDPDKPAPTISKFSGQSLSGYGLMSHEEKRRYTIPELRRLASFPDSFVFCGDYGQGAERIGNCVPPRFAQAIAEHIRDEILEA